MAIKRSFAPLIARYGLTWRAHGPAGSPALRTRLFSQRNPNTPPTTGRISAITLLASKSSHLDPSTIVSKLPILPQTPESLQNVPVLLATPAFAAWAQAHNTLLPLLMGHLFRDVLRTPATVQDLYSISAVVDKLPIPRPAPFRDASLYEQTGCEGISLLLVDKGFISGDIARPMRRRDVSMPEIEPTVTFAAFGIQDHGKIISTEVGIRLANTIFVTEKPRTMLTAQWGYASDTGKVKLKEAKDLVICRIESQNQSSIATPYVPLYPITQPRRVMGSMGNVLSQVSAGDGSTESKPASAELEQALPAFIEKHRLQNHKLAVWALITPGGAESRVDADAQNGDVVNISNAIRNGARLHRLMSGGGGWGKKQGLLSLDPEYSYQEEHSSGHRHPIEDLFDPQKTTTIDDSFDIFPTPIEFRDGKLVTPLSEAAKLGDSVQFFVAPLDTEVPFDQGPEGESNLSESQDYIFGVIPPTDTASFSSSEVKSEHEPLARASEDGLLVLNNHFGALSENGMTLAMIEQGKSTTAEESRAGSSGTKIDVPGSRITIINRT